MAEHNAPDLVVHDHTHCDERIRRKMCVAQLTKPNNIHMAAQQLAQQHTYGSLCYALVGLLASYSNHYALIIIQRSFTFNGGIRFKHSVHHV